MKVIITADKEIEGLKEGTFQVNGPFGTYKILCKYVEIENDIISFLHEMLYKFGSIMVIKTNKEGADFEIIVNDKFFCKPEKQSTLFDKLYEQKDQRGL